MNKNIVGVFISNSECSEALGQEYLLYFFNAAAYIAASFADNKN